MQDEKPSATAWRVALGRAAHQIYDTPKIFDDPLALRIVGACAHGQSPETFFNQRYKRSIRTTLLRAILADLCACQFRAADCHGRTDRRRLRRFVAGTDGLRCVAHVMIASV